MAAAEATPNVLNWHLLRRLRTELPFRAEFFLSTVAFKVLQTAAARAESQVEFLFFQAAVTVATLSRRLIVNKGPNQAPTWSNNYTMVVAGPKAGKTNAHIVFDKIRRRLYLITGMDNTIRAGTPAGVFRSTVECARRGGQPLHAPDEGIMSVVSLIEKKADGGLTNFKPDVFFSSGWSGADVGRAKASGADLHTEDARITLLAKGTLSDILQFHRICLQHYANRGLLGRFLTVFAPLYTTRCALPEADNEEEESLLAMSAPDLSTMLLDAFVSMHRQIEAATFDGFHFSDDAIQHLANLRASEIAEQGCNQDDLDWSDRLTSHLLSHIQREFRLTEMIEKWSLILHVLEQCLNSINFMERTISDQPVDQLITMTSVDRAEALVRRAQEQDGFFVQVVRIATTGQGRGACDVLENVDFVIYKCLRQLIMMWPGAVVTSESFSDRCSRLNVQIGYEDFCDAARALDQMGTLSREAGATRITRPGAFTHRRTPRREFRFYKTHPDMLASSVLDELSLDLLEYTRRYNMDYYQVVDAQALRGRRSEKKFDQWIESIPRTLLPHEESVESEPKPASQDVSGAHASTTTLGNAAFPLFPRHAKFQHEETSLRFGAALGKKPPTKQRRLIGPTDQQHFYRLPGGPIISNFIDLPEEPSMSNFKPDV